MKPGQYCAIVCERIGARQPEHLSNHVVKMQELPGTLLLTPHSFNSVDYLTGSPAIRDDILKDFAQLLAAEAIAFQETEGSPSVGHNCAERLVQLVSERPGHFSHNRDAAEVRDFFAVLPSFRFGLLALSDVNARTDVPDERAIVGKSRRSNIQNPAIFTITSSQAVFHRERLPCIKGANIYFKTAVKVFAVNALCPPIAKFLLQRAAGKVEPTFVEKGAELVRGRHPDHHRRGVGHGAKTSFALPQRVLRQLLCGHIHRDSKQPGAFGVPVVHTLAPRADPALRPIR